MMERARYTFKVGQRVFYYAGGSAHGRMTGPYTVTGLVPLSDGGTLYRIKSRSRERLALEDELKLALDRRRGTP
jgi:hypothetical protein